MWAVDWTVWQFPSAKNERLGARCDKVGAEVPNCLLAFKNGQCPKVVVMHVLLERFIVSSTPAWRVLLAVFFSTPFFVLVALAAWLALGLPEVRAGMVVPHIEGMLIMLVLATCLNVGVAMWMWPRRHSSEPVQGATVLVCQVIGLSYTVVTIMSGMFTTATNVVLVGVLAVGLLLFERKPVLLAYVACVGLLLLHDLGVLVQWWPYAPGVNALAFEGREPVWWFSLWRQFVFLAGFVVLLGLILLLFDRLDGMHGKLKRLSYTDGLTGLANRRRFMEVLHTEVARQVRTGQPLCLVLIDADHFKQVNDEHGHATGDEVLRALGKLLLACVRTPTDLASRLGGEEFALILPDTSCERALAVCERLRAQLAQQRFGEAERPLQVTLSMGVVPCQGPDAEAILRRADRQLYRAKTSGRDRVCVDDTTEGRGA
jgi:diguanylate cyclase (GGDEF)-like protein